MQIAALQREVKQDTRFARDVLKGLSGARKSIPCQWFYDYRGSELFEEITGLAEYYPTRTEIGILRQCASAVGKYVGTGASVVEIGSGSSRKTPLLLHALPKLRSYIPVDLSEEFLHVSVRALNVQMPELRCSPVVADFSDPRDASTIRSALPDAGPFVGFFSGSTIGNFTPEGAIDLLCQLGAVLGQESWMVIGVDSTQDPKILIPAYDDSRGVTAEFNLNVLRRINRELAGTFVLNAFAHQARFDTQHGRIEMHLVSRRDQQVRVCSNTFYFREGETIHTENSYKYPVTQFETIARSAGWHPLERWGDTMDGFGVFLLRRRD